MLKDKIYEKVVLNERKEDLDMGSFWDRARDEGRREIIENMIKNGFTDEQIMSVCSITKKQLDEMKKEILAAV